MTTENKQDNSRGVKHKGAAKVARIPIKVVPLEQKLKKPEWIRAQLPTGKKFFEIKNILRDQKMHTVCEEASCPNIGECFSRGTATFMIMGDICTRRCPFCDVGHGRPNALDPEEPQHLASSVAAMNLRYVVITSVDRDDLRDGGAQHFADCITAIRERSPNTKIEILVPDFRGRMDIALEILAKTPPDVMNHNLETHPRLYKQARPGANYQHSLELLRRYKEMMPHIPTKSGIMVGLGETDDEVREIMRDMRANNIEMITVGQYLQPSNSHLPVLRYVTPEMFKQFEHEAYAMGFTNAAIGAMVRSSYHAAEQAAVLSGETANEAAAHQWEGHAEEDSLRQNESGGSQPAQHISHKRRTRCRHQHVVAETKHSGENPVEKQAEDANQSLNQGITADKIAPALTSTGNPHRACGHAAHENSEYQRLRVGGVTEENTEIM